MSPAFQHALMVGAISFLANLPLGYLRGGVRPGLKVHPKRSPAWWKVFGFTMLYVHLSIPIVAVARWHWGLKPWYVHVPVFIAIALFAQWVGELIRRRRDASDTVP